MSHQASAQCLNCMWKMVHTLVFVERRSSNGMAEARIYTGDDKVLLRVMVDCHIWGMLLFFLPQGNLDAFWIAVVKNIFSVRVVKHWKRCHGDWYISALGDTQNLTKCDPEQPALTLKLERALELAQVGGSGCCTQWHPEVLANLHFSVISLPRQRWRSTWRETANFSPVWKGFGGRGKFQW